MRLSSPVEIRLLELADVPAAMRLKEFAGWNQTEQDWFRLLQLEPRGCFCATKEERVIATTTTTCYGTTVAWIGMVLVDPDHRGQGIASNLMREALKYLDFSGVQTIKLDATKVGQVVYEKFGFTVESVVERWAGTGREVATRVCRPIEGPERAQLLSLDEGAFKADRSGLLDMLIRDSVVPPVVCTSSDQTMSGYGFARNGSLAAYVGPVVATSVEFAEALLDHLLDQLAGKEVFVDLNTQFEGGAEILTQRGFVKRRVFARMRRGAGSSEHPLVFGIAGPEVG